MKNIIFDPDFASPADYARMYRELGLQVVPAKMPTEDKAWKRPIIKWREYENALTDDDTFGGWYASNGEFRHRPNMGLITGNASGTVFVVDGDFHSKPQSKNWLHDLLDQWNDGIPLRTPTQKTGGGGIQIFLRAPEGWDPPTNKTTMGIDIRGRGGFAMLPPSLHESGAHYEWMPGFEPWSVDIIEAPLWMVEAIDDLLSQCAQYASVERGERTESPAHAIDPFGQIVDGREDYMTRLIWARVVNLYREFPRLTDKASEEALRDAYITYEQNVKTRLFEPGVPNHMLLEREGRGISLFEQKWKIAIDQWETKVKEAAALPAPEKKLESPQEQQQDEDLSVAPTSIMDDVFEILDIRAIKSRPDQKWLIEGAVPERALGWVYGTPGCGKSFLEIGKGLSIAAGLPQWFGRKIYRGGPVIYISSEGVADMKWRIRAWEISLGVNADDIPFYLIHETINFMRQEDRDKLLRTINSVIQITGEIPVLITVDTVSRVLPGADENLQKDMTIFVGACDEVKDAFGCTVTGVHHTSRSGNLRGSTVLDGAGDFIFEIIREEGCEIGEMYAKKIKAAQDGWRQNFRLRKVDMGDIGGNSSLYAEATDDHPIGDDGVKWPSKPICQEIIDAIRKAWDDGKPWSVHYHAKADGRHAQSHMNNRWEIEPKLGLMMIEKWLLNGVLEVAMRDARLKVRGLKVIKDLYEPGERMFRGGIDT